MTNMTRYEILLLATPGITVDEMNGFEKQFEKLVKDGKGNVISFEKWGKCRLAYPVRNNDYGVYLLARFEMEQPQAFFKEIKLLLDVKYNETIMRSANVKLDPKASLNYFRPDSVEGIRTGNVDEFLRENKMEGLLPRQAGAGRNDLDDDFSHDEHDEEGA